MEKTVILITGAGGFLGGLLAQALQNEQGLTDLRLVLVDIIEPVAPPNANAITIKADLTDAAQVDALFQTAHGVPDTVYCLHGIMSRGSEDNFDLGVKVRKVSDRAPLPPALHLIVISIAGEEGRLIKFIFTSSLAVYGGPLPDVVTPDTIATPQGAYGMGKLVDEIFINEYTRRGFVDGRILRLPTIVVRAGTPSAAASSFISAAPRPPQHLPHRHLPHLPALSLPLWVASPETTVRNLVRARTVPAAAFLAHTRVVCLPGFTTTVREELAALAAVAGPAALALVRFEPDEVSARVVSSWPARFDDSYARGLGFVGDEGGMEPIVRRFRDQLAAGKGSSST
ncbi:hypothetical protein C8Q80DRAFT_1216566 [Daedaleopsis nitida]|nr:hypothetical protein C8Q80DRAFT_1216566 [Daedaleopsis nitida]